MKGNYLFLCIFLLGFMLFSQNENSSFWVYDMEEAQKIAKTENKTIAIYFTGSDWCRPCMMLKEDFFNNYKFNKYKDSYVFLYVDIPRDQDLLTEKQKVNNYKLLKNYNQEKTFPLICIVNKKGKVLDTISGYSSLRDPTYYFDLFEKYIK